MEKTIKSEDDFVKVTCNYSKKTMMEYGFGLWDAPDKNNEQLLLIPGYAYNYIPDKIKLATINKEYIKFDRKKHQFEMREGCLPWGIICKSDS